MEELEEFNKYWTNRYEYCKKYFEKELSIINPESLRKE